MIWGSVILFTSCHFLNSLEVSWLDLGDSQASTHVTKTNTRSLGIKLLLIPLLRRNVRLKVIITSLFKLKILALKGTKNVPTTDCVVAIFSTLIWGGNLARVRIPLALILLTIKSSENQALLSERGKKICVLAFRCFRVFKLFQFNTYLS